MPIVIIINEYFYNLAFLSFNLFSQNNNINYVGNYKAKSQGENYTVAIKKSNKAILTSVDY